MSTNVQIYEALKELGMPLSMTGYPYIARAVQMCLEEPEYTSRMTSVYSLLAKDYGVSVNTIVRNIAYCIQTTLKNSAKLEEYFGIRNSYADIKPNEFLAGVCEHIRMRQEDSEDEFQGK